MPWYEIKKPKIKKKFTLGEKLPNEDVFLIELGKDGVYVFPEIPWEENPKPLLKLSKDMKKAVETLAEVLRDINKQVVEGILEKFLSEYSLLSVGPSFDEIRRVFESSLREYERFLKRKERELRREDRDTIRNLRESIHRFIKGLERNDPYYINRMINLIADPGPYKESIYKLFKKKLIEKYGRKGLAPLKQIPKLLEKYEALVDAFREAEKLMEYELLERGTKILLSGISLNSLKARYALKFKE